MIDVQVINLQVVDLQGNERAGGAASGLLVQ